MKTRALFTCLLIFVFSRALLCGPAAVYAEPKGKLIMFHAGSLSVPFKAMEKAFEAKYPEVDLLREASGSQKAARKVSDLKKPCDIMASADYKVIDKLLIPDYADWNVRLAINQLVLCYIDDIFLRPRSAFVADFVGMKNIFEGQFRDTRVRIQDIEIMLDRQLDTGKGHIAIRPEDILIGPKILRSDSRNTFKGTVKSIIDQGFTYEVHVSVGDVVFKSLITKKGLYKMGIQEGDSIPIGFKPASVHSI